MSSELDTVSLDGLSPSLDKNKNGDENCKVSCIYALFQFWNWRSRARGKRERQSRESVVDNIEQLSIKINASEARHIEFQQVIIQCVRTDDKIRARRILLQQKRNANMLKSLCTYREELESVLMSLDESNEQQELVASFKSANRVLKTHIGKGSAVEAFDDLADDLQEAKQDVEELQQAVAGRAALTDDGIEEEMRVIFGTNDALNPPPIVFPEAPRTILETMKARVPKTQEQLLVA